PRPPASRVRNATARAATSGGCRRIRGAIPTSIAATARTAASSTSGRWAPTAGREVRAMTPTSETGRSRRAGFTLVELLMTVAIIGVAAGAVVLSMPDPRPSVGEDAERFAARLQRAREEAILSNRTMAVEATPGGYAFSAFDGARWSPLRE